MVRVLCEKKIGEMTQMSMQLTHLVVILACYWFGSCVGKDYGCKDAYSCCGTRAEPDEYENIDCDGYYACCSSALLYADSIECDGSFSCYNSTEIYCPTESGCECKGYQSCAKVSELFVYDGAARDTSALACNAYEACYSSSIIYYGGTLTVRGYESVKSSTISMRSTNVNDINATGARALYDSSWYFYEHGVIRNFGVYSFSDVYLSCSGVRCTVYCYDFGCYGASSSDMHGSGIEYECDYNTISNELCDTQYTYMSNVIDSGNIPVIPTIEPGNGVCKDAGIICEDRQACEKSSLSTSKGSVCCTASNSCHDAYITVDMTSVSNEYNVAVKCDGSSSCEQASYIKVIGTGDVYCSGHYSCHSAVIKYIDGGETVNVLCLGEGSCYGAEVAGLTNLYCMEYQSCFDGFVIAMTNNVYGYGYQSLYEAVIYDCKKVYCSSYQACRNAKIAQIEELYILGYQGLLQAQVNPNTDNITNIMYCIAYGACWEANIQSVETIYASGEYSLYNSYITGVRNLAVDGNDALSLSYIYTGIWETNWHVDETVVIDIKGTNTETYTVFCDNNSTCHINCESSGACGKQIAICYGECDISCSYGKSECPTVVHDNATHPIYPRLPFAQG